MNVPLRVLIVEDSQEDADRLVEALRAGGYVPEVRRVHTREAMAEALREVPWDAVLAAYVLEQFSGLAAIEMVKATGRDIPILIISGKVGEEAAAQVIRAGAGDLILKRNLARLVPALERELADAASRRAGREALEARAREHAVLQAVVDHVPAGIALFDGQTLQVKWANERYRLGLDRPGKHFTLVGRSLEEVLPAPVLVELQDHFRRVTEAGEPYENPEQVIAGFPRGLSYWHMSLVPVPASGSPPFDVLHVAIDITDQVRARRQAESERARLATILAALPVGVLIIGCHGEILEANAAAERLYRGSAPASTPLQALRSGPAWWVATGQPVTPGQWPSDRALALGEPVLGEEITLQRADGTRATVLDSAAPLRDESGQVDGVVVVLQDITERRQVEEDRERLLRETAANRAELEAVFNSLTEGVLIIDPGGNLLRMNPAATRMIAAMAPGETWPIAHWDELYELRRPDGSPLPPEAFPTARVLRGETLTDVPADIYQRATGRVRHFSYSGALVRNSRGAPLYAVLSIRDVTELLNAERALEQALNRAQQYLDVAGVMMLALDAAGRVTMVNPAGLAILGRSPEEVVGQDWIANFIPAELRDEVRRVSEQMLLGNVTAVEYHENMVLARGGPRILAFHNAVLRDEQGQVIGLLSSGEDITERKQAEEALRESETRFRSLFHDSRASMLLVDPSDGAIVDANPAAARFYGYPLEALKQMTIWELNVLPREVVAHELMRARGEEQDHFVFPHRLANGEIRTVEVYSGPLQRHGRTLLYSIIHDITERRRAEAEQERLLAELDATVSSIADALVVYGTQGEVLRANPAAERIFHFTPEERGLSAEARWIKRCALRPDGTPMPVQELPTMRALRGEAAHTVVMWLPGTAEGDGVWVSASAAPIRTADGQMLGVVATYTDITGLRRLQEQQEDLLRMISHDLRAPLTIIAGHAQLLDEELASSGSESLRMSVDAIARGTQRMNAMIQDLVDAVRLEGGKLMLRCQALRLDTFVADLIHRAGMAMDVSRLVTEIPADLPPIPADPDRLERILMNLISNALKYSFPNTPVRITATLRDGRVVVAVTDQGPGISPEDMPRLFTRYFRGAGPRKPDSIGLGLYITRKLVEAHGGHIWAESTLGQGSTFAFDLPLA